MFFCGCGLLNFLTIKEDTRSNAKCVHSSCYIILPALVKMIPSVGTREHIFNVNLNVMVPCEMVHSHVIHSIISEILHSL